MRRTSNKEKRIINDYIKCDRIAVVGENGDGFNNILSKKEALSKADEMCLDLIQMSINNEGVCICKIMDYKKYVYDQNKKKKEQEKKQKQNSQQVKEIRFTPNTDDHDFDFKLRHAINFLKNNNKLKASVFFKGREMNYKDKGKVLLLKLAEKLEDVGIAEGVPKMEGRRMIIMFKPKK